MNPDVSAAVAALEGVAVVASRPFDKDTQDALGLAGKKAASRAVRNDIGDEAMSGWNRAPRKRQIQITARYTASTTEVEMSPSPQARGPMRVLDSGRKAYRSGDRRVKGSYVSKRTGQRTQRTRTVGGTVGATRGKGTWDDAAVLMGRELPPTFETAFTRRVMDVFTKGR